MMLRRVTPTAAAPALDAVAAAVVMKRFLQHVLVQAYGQVDRMLSFNLLLAGLQVLQNVCLAHNMWCAASYPPSLQRDGRFQVRLRRSCKSHFTLGHIWSRPGLWQGLAG